MTEQIKQLKGGKFLNRYVIKAKLKALTPFHIGDGSTITREGMIDDKTNKKHQINAVATDGNGKAYIPGSSLRGALRDWLRLGYENMNGNTTSDIKNLSDLERIFGTQLNEGKLEVWDAYCTSLVNAATDTNGQMCFWNKDRMTYVAKSVAIDPKTGTAEEGKLYNYELVPQGATFAATFSAQNLSDTEAGLFLAVLKGFNHQDNPITLGAMTKLDFGRFEIDGFEIYRLNETNIATWQKMAENPDEKRAGYDLIADKVFALPKDALAELETVVLPTSKTIAKHKETWTLNLKTPLVIRSGSSFIWKNAGKKKTRNYQMEYDWGQTVKRDGFHHVSDLYHSIEIKGSGIAAYYHIPSSSVRGALRAWTIEHLLPQAWWNIEDELKKGNMEKKPKHLDNILSLFGYAVDSGNKEITKEYTKAGRLTIRVVPFSTNAARPAVDGDNWVTTAAAAFGPTNAARHIKPRNPIDRVTQAAKEGGLHHNLEFSKGQLLTIVIEIREPEEFDKNILKYWKDEVCSGMIRLGGLSGIGRGRVDEINHKKINGGTNAI